MGGVLVMGIFVFFALMFTLRCPKCKKFWAQQETDYYTYNLYYDYTKHDYVPSNELINSGNLGDESTKIVTVSKMKCKFCNHEWEEENYNIENANDE
jgi:hypothetical protein